MNIKYRHHIELENGEKIHSGDLVHCIYIDKDWYHRKVEITGIISIHGYPNGTYHDFEVTETKPNPYTGQTRKEEIKGNWEVLVLEKVKDIENKVTENKKMICDMIMGLRDDDLYELITGWDSKIALPDGCFTCLMCEKTYGVCEEESEDECLERWRRYIADQ